MNERLTIRKGYGQYLPKNHSQEQRICDKLGHLEDIEEKYGVDFRLFYKAHELGIYFVSNTRIMYVPPKDITMHFTHLETDWGRKLYLWEFGKTWAFTKEELEVKE